MASKILTTLHVGLIATLVGFLAGGLLSVTSGLELLQGSFLLLLSFFGLLGSSLLDQSDGGTSNTTLLSDVNSSGSLSDSGFGQTLLVHLSEGGSPSELGRLLLQVEVSASLGVQEKEELHVK